MRYYIDSSTSSAPRRCDVCMHSLHFQLSFDNTRSLTKALIWYNSTSIRRNKSSLSVFNHIVHMCSATKLPFLYSQNHAMIVIRVFVLGYSLYIIIMFPICVRNRISDSVYPCTANSHSTIFYVCVYVHNGACFSFTTIICAHKFRNYLFIRRVSLFLNR